MGNPLTDCLAAAQLEVHFREDFFWFQGWCPANLVRGVCQVAAAGDVLQLARLRAEAFEIDSTGRWMRPLRAEQVWAMTAAGAYRADPATFRATRGRNARGGSEAYLVRGLFTGRRAPGS